MKTIYRMALSAIVAFAAFAAHGGGNKSSFKQQLLGTWTLTSAVLDQGGTKSEPFGSNPKGSVMFAPNGRFALVITRSDVPKFASNVRTTGTPEENKAAVQGSIGYFGTYMTNDAEKMLIMKVEGSTFPNWAGTDQKRSIDISGDDLKFTNQTPSIGPGTVTVTWKRVKEQRTTAQR